MIQILEENEFFLILNKPEAVSVHNQSPSLVEFLAAQKKPAHFVNRLDQDTSGLMLIALKPEYHQPLAESLEQGQKFYRALLRGPWKNNEKTRSWNWPLSDKSEGRKNPQGISSERKICETRIEVIRSNTFFTEILAELITGRQHQIRKHCALAKQAIVGDSRYNEASYNSRIESLYSNNRMQLHAEKLKFNFKNKNYLFEKKYSLDAFFKN